ncbi:MAG: T9SS type A sorting domain-containing protein [Ignavibacteria bacterium]
MKNLLKFLCLAVTFSFLSTSLSLAEGFNSVYSADGVYVIAAGDQGNIFRSYNSGNTWAKYTETGINFKSVFTLGTDVWLATDNGKVYKSSTISPLMTPYSTGVTTSVNSVYFVNANIGFICGDNGLLMKSVNGGAVWSSANTGIAAGIKLNSVSFKDALNGIVVGDNGKVYITANGGTNWIPEIVTTTRNLLDTKFYSDGIGIAGEWGTLLFKSTASAWNYVDTKINTDIRGITGVSFNDIHVCGGGGFIRNNINGNNEFLNFEPNPMLANLVDIVYANGIGFAVSSLNNAIIRSTNGGTNWGLTAGATATYNWTLKQATSGNIGNPFCLHPQNRNGIFILAGSTLYRSLDKGNTWTTLSSGIPGGNCHSFFVNPLDTNIMVATKGSGSTSGRVIKSTNYGTTWFDLIFPIALTSYGMPLEADPNNPNTLYLAPDGDSMMVSTNYGNNWTSLGGGEPGNIFRSPCDVAIQYGNSNVMWVGDGVTGSGTGKLWKTVNGGINWTLVNSTTGSEIPMIATTPLNVNLVYHTTWSSGSFWKSTSAGSNFTDLNQSGSLWATDIARDDPTAICYDLYGSNAYVSLNGGDNFTSVNVGSSPAAGISYMDKANLLIQHGGGVFKFSVNYSVITAITENTISNIPNSFALAQNYPNPFNPTTNIKFDIPKSGNVSLKVYNELGKEVNTLINSFRSAGTYEINFDASALSSGIYFYTLRTDGLTATKKMLLVK